MKHNLIPEQYQALLRDAAANAAMCQNEKKNVIKGREKQYADAIKFIDDLTTQIRQAYPTIMWQFARDPKTKRVVYEDGYYKIVERWDSERKEREKRMASALKEAHA